MMSQDNATAESDGSAKKRVVCSPRLPHRNPLMHESLDSVISLIPTFLGFITVLVTRAYSYFLRLWSSRSAGLRRMKPTRIRMCHSLVMNYGLYKRMEIFVRIHSQLVRGPLLIHKASELNPQQNGR